MAEELAADPLVQLAADTERVQFKPAHIRHPAPEMAAYVLVFRTEIDAKEVANWRRRSLINRLRDEIDSGKFNCRLIAATCEAIERDGVQLVDDAGLPFTFADRRFQQALKAVNAEAAVKAFLRNDAYIASVSAEVARCSGIGVDVTAEDDE